MQRATADEMGFLIDLCIAGFLIDIRVSVATDPEKLLVISLGLLIAADGRIVKEPLGFKDQLALMLAMGRPGLRDFEL